MLKKAASCVTTLISLLLMLVWIFSMWESHVEDKGIALIAEGNKLIKAGDPASLQKSIQSLRRPPRLSMA